MVSVPTTVSTLSSHPVADELTEELEQLLDSFCSDVQQQFCVDQHIATQQQLLRIKQTVQQVRQMIKNQGGWVSMGVSDEASRAMHRHLRQMLIRVSLEMLDSYQAIAHQRQITFLPAGQAQAYMHHDWHTLSQKFDNKALEQAKWVQLLDNLKQLQKAWQHPHQQVMKIIHSLLATFDAPPGSHVVAIDRHNYAQLGLKRNAIGSRQLVFENGVLTRQQQMAIVSDLCERFSSIFRENARHNLQQIDTQLRRGQPTSLQQRCQHLYQQLFATTYTSSSSDSTSSHSSSHDAPPQQPHQPFDQLACPPPALHPTRPDAAASSSRPNPVSRLFAARDVPTTPTHAFPSLEQVQQERLERWHMDQQQQQQQQQQQEVPPPPPAAAMRANVPAPIDTTAARLSGTQPTELHPPPPSPPSPIPPVPSLMQATTADTGSRPPATLHPPIHPPLHAMALRPTPFVDTSSMTILQMPMPSFIPAPWQWPDLLKTRQPYKPLLFGLIRRKRRNGRRNMTRRTTNDAGFLARLRFLFFPSTNSPFIAMGSTVSATTPHDDPSMATNAPENPTPTTPMPSQHAMTPLLQDAAFASVSMSQLGQHFVHTSQRFYADVMLHCQLKYQQDTAVLKEIGADLVHMYAALQLDISQLDMQRIIAILNDLNALDQAVAHSMPAVPTTPSDRHASHASDMDQDIGQD
ncbi:hypothetical protein BC940DRAFT_287154 [Gongronella butleri]|nr:hypothetical protein BC940DRAFT_287154 [Gongronella butleri]